MSNLKAGGEDLFLERYKKLNERQQQAVDTIYGAVMVIAGPGTGKTEVLAMRIANLLRSEAQVQPQEILCLTYTDEATNSMRRRLLTITGTAAHKVSIFTFHGFCNTVIQDHGEYFSKREMQPIDDLEKAELLHDILEQLPSGHVLRRLSGDIYYDTGRLSKLFDTMKTEHLSSELIGQRITEYLDSLPQREEYIYKRNGKGFAKGDLKQGDIDKEAEQMEKTRAAAAIFDTYQQRMKEMGRYDYNDMILWVLEAFKEYPWLLQHYQERFQFILVDEFQDTNGAQNEILRYLSSYWDAPNVFVVGDDDQSIYEFQGARVRNIIEFYERHKDDISVIVLPQNYRSSQEVIDRATATIKYNKQRLVNQLHELKLDKNIVAANERFGREDIVHPIVRVYQNTLQEEADTVMRIEALREKGVPLREIAVLYAQHKQADNIIALMERRGIAYNVKKPVNILQQPLIEQLLNILRYLDAERKKPFEGEPMLFELMHAPWLGIDTNDIATLSLYLQTNRKETGPIRWRQVLSNPLLIEALNLRTATAMHRLGRNLDDWERQQLALPLPLLVEKIVHEGGIVAHIIRMTDHVWQLQVLHTFFEFVKGAHARNGRIKPPALLMMIEKMEKENIALPLQRVVQNDNGVHFYTAHSAKGNEFEHVFLVGCVDSTWEKKRGGQNQFRLPDNITATEVDADSSYKQEVARRLFYVALTRAKKHLTVSYAVNDNAGKGLQYSMFIDEISDAEDREIVALPEAAVSHHLQWAMQPVPEIRIKTSNAEWIDRLLQQFTMSATQLTKFLRCPLTFYYETILKVPYQKSDALAFGSAVHFALERMYIEMKSNNGTFPAKERVIELFHWEMKRESGCFTAVQYDRRKEQGEQILGDYYDTYINSLSKNVEIEYKIPRYLLQGIPVTGKIDKIELNNDECVVVDYKTGDPDKSVSASLNTPNEKDPLGGDYWRQMVFYKLLIENYTERNWRVKKGMFDYVQKNKTGSYTQQVVPMYQQDEDTVMGQLKDAYTRIMNHEYDRGCGEERCHWCNFAKRYELIRPANEVEMDDE